MHKDGSLADLLSEKEVIIEQDDAGQAAEEVRATTEQSRPGILGSERCLDASLYDIVSLQQACFGVMIPLQ
jgi:hypothetical protein